MIALHVAAVHVVVVVALVYVGYKLYKYATAKKSAPAAKPAEVKSEAKKEGK